MISLNKENHPHLVPVSINGKFLVGKCDLKKRDGACENRGLLEVVESDAGGQFKWLSDPQIPKCNVCPVITMES